MHSHGTGSSTSARHHSPAGDGPVVPSTATGPTRPDGLEVFAFNLTGVTAVSPGLAGHDLASWRALASVQVVGDQPACGLFVDGQGQHLAALARIHTPGQMIVMVALVPPEWLDTAAGQYAPLFDALLDIPLSGTALTPVQARATPWQPSDRLLAFQSLIDTLGGGEEGFRRAMLLLEGALHERGVMIHGHPGSINERLAFVQGLLALLPAAARQEFTFSTNRHETMTSQARLVFAERHVSSARWLFDLASGTEARPDEVESAASPYVDYLRGLRHDLDDGGLLAVIDRLDPLVAAQLSAAGGAERLVSLQQSLAAAALRDQVDGAIQAGDDVEMANLIAVLKRVPPGGELRLRYADRLLDAAVRSRDADASAALAGLMDSDPALDVILWGRLNRILSVSPDAVYAVLRTHIASFARPDEKWLLRLKAASLASLRVAFAEADEDTILNWLQLIAREPAHYGLGDVLNQAIHAAQQIAHERDMPPRLIQGLITIAAKRSPVAAHELSEDDALLSALPGDLRAALRDGSGDPRAIATAYGLEVLLLALWRASAAPAPDLFTPYSIETVWSLTTGEPGASSSTVFAMHILDDWLDDGVGWMPDDSVETLLTLALQDGRDDRFHRLAHSLRDSDRVAPMVATAFVRAGRSVSDILALVAQQLAVGDLTQQDALDVYVSVLTSLGWSRETQPLVTQLSRLIGQQAALMVPDEVVWRLIATGTELRDEATVRIAARRIQARLELLTGDSDLIEYLARLIGIVGGSGARSTVENWWREFVTAQTTARLAKLERQLEGRKGLDDLREIVHSVVAFRRLLGTKTLKQFAEDITVAFNLLQAFSDSFEPQVKRSGGFDAEAVRAELDARRAEVPPEQIQILANNMKELADLIASLGDNRSKAGLIRRSEDLDRQLITGEQLPHGAVDAMKWISGYLSGAQVSDEDDDD